MVVNFRTCEISQSAQAGPDIHVNNNKKILISTLPKCEILNENCEVNYRAENFIPKKFAIITWSANLFKSLISVHYAFS
jgi:hypothetical protein